MFIDKYFYIRYNKYWFNKTNIWFLYNNIKIIKIGIYVHIDNNINPVLLSNNFNSKQIWVKINAKHLTRNFF